MAEGTAGGTVVSGGPGETGVSEAGGLEGFLHARTELQPLRSDQVMVARRLRRRFSLCIEVRVQRFPPALLPAWRIWPGQQDLRPLLGARLDSRTWLHLFHLLFIIRGGLRQARRGGRRRAFCSYLGKRNLSGSSSRPFSFLLEEELSFLFSTGKQIISSQQKKQSKMTVDPPAKTTRAPLVERRQQPWVQDVFLWLPAVVPENRTQIFFFSLSHSRSLFFHHSSSSSVLGI